jgi:hypothetical protein
MRSCITATPIGFYLKAWRCRPWWNPVGGFGNFDDFGGWVEGHLTLFQRIKLVDSLERIRVSGKLVGFFSFVDFFFPFSSLVVRGLCFMRMLRGTVQIGRSKASITGNGYSSFS